ncbi:MAG: hypothetical protein LUC37_02945 [Prevotella sp.]|nr:hypothetical protein [Prevotella sp.]
MTYAFASGGLVDFTGPAWVDGSKSKPEAFLSAEDTARIGRAADIFADIPLLNSSSVENFNDNVSYGDTSIEINLNIDSIDSNIDIEYMLDRMKNEIVNVATPERSNVILRKNYK